MDSEAKECYDEVTAAIDETAEMEEEMFPGKDVVEMPACVAELDMDLEEMKMQMVNAMKECKSELYGGNDEDKDAEVEEDDKDDATENKFAPVFARKKRDTEDGEEKDTQDEDMKACMENKKPEVEAPVQDCMDSVKAVFDEMKENIEDMKDQVDGIVEDMEMPDCAKDWDKEGIKEGVKDSIKEEMTKPKEDVSKRNWNFWSWFETVNWSVKSMDVEQPEMTEEDVQCLSGIKDQIKDNLKEPMEMPECAANFDDFKANMNAMFTFIQDNKVDCEDAEGEDAMMACMSNLMAGEFSEEELACKGEIMELNECEMEMEDGMDMDDMDMDDMDMDDMDKDEDKEAFELPDSCELLNLTDEQIEALKNCDLEDKVQCLSPTTEGGMSLRQRQRISRIVIKSANCVEDLFGCERRIVRGNKSPKSCMGGEMPDMPEFEEAEMPEVPDMGAMPDMDGAGKPNKGKKMKCYKKKEADNEERTFSISKLDFFQLFWANKV